MFFELPQIDKIQTGITTLSQLKQQLDRKALHTFSSNPEQIQNSLKNTLDSVLDQSQKLFNNIKDIQMQVDMGYFIPTSLNIDQLVYDPAQLPQWFQFVFKKQYQKQKKNLDGLCKKAYKVQSLHQVKHNLQKQIQSFKLLVQRYEVLSQKQKTSINIIGQAQILSSKCKCVKQKYLNYCKSISTKILSFLQQTVSKSMNFSNSMNSLGQTVTNSFNVKLQPDQFQRGYLTNKFRQTTQSGFRQSRNGFKQNIGFRQNNHTAYQTDGFYRSKAPKSVDFHGKTMYGRSSNDFGKTGMAYNRYVPRYVNTNTGIYDFYQ